MSIEIVKFDLTPDHNDFDVQIEVEKKFRVVFMTNAMLDGAIWLEDWVDFLLEEGIDPVSLVSCWEQTGWIVI